MKVTQLLVAATGAATVLAAPQDGHHAHASRDESSEIEYYPNWAGAIAKGSGFNYVRGTVVVPTPETPAGGDPNTLYSSSIWVGIDGNLCQSAIIQTGIDVSIFGGVPSYDAWYEWWPAGSVSIDNFPVAAGDSIRMSVYAYNTTAGMTMIENLTQDVSFNTTFSSETDVLCLETAEWIVEDFNIGTSLVPFVNFTTVTFTDCYTNEGGVENAVIADIQQDSILTSCTHDDISSVTCSYV